MHFSQPSPTNSSIFVCRVMLCCEPLQENEVNVTWKSSLRRGSGVFVWLTWIISTAQFTAPQTAVSAQLIRSNLDTEVKMKKPWSQLYWPTQCSKSLRITIAWLSSLGLLPAISTPWLDGTLPLPSVVINLWPWFQFSLWFHLQRWQ